MKPFEPQKRDERLFPHAHRVEIVGPLDSLKFPPLCPRCGAGAVRRLPVVKVFLRVWGFDDDRANTYEIERLDVPFCNRCIDEHRRLEPRQTPTEQVLRAAVTPPGIGALLTGAWGLFLLGLAPLGYGRAGARGALILGGVAAFFLLLALGAARKAWARTARHRVPPQTDVTLAFDFSDDLSERYAGERRRYAIRDKSFAKAFAELNGE